MMTLYVSPYRRIPKFRRAMDQMMDERTPSTESKPRELRLAIDVKGDEEAYDITALIPGVEAEDIDVEVLNNTVSIRGEFKDGEVGDEKYLVSELPFGRFSRTITLPTTLDASKAEATLKNGVFTVHVPKSEASRPKQIKISAS